MVQTNNERNLSSYARNVYSQNGEDGIIQEACARLNITKGYFVEFGAWDGKYLSNTYNLYENYGWSGCYIEGDQARFHTLSKNIDPEKILAINCFVSIDGENTLDKILKRNGIDRHLDILSIDIDSDDLAVWASIKDYRSKIVVIEYNPTIPNACEFVQAPGVQIGNAPLSIIKLGAAKGYWPFAVTDTNLLFVQKELFDQLRLRRAPTISELRQEVGFIFLGYDGSIMTTGDIKGNRWNYNAPILQTFPKFLRYYGRKKIFIDVIKIFYIVMLHIFHFVFRPTYIKIRNRLRFRKVARASENDLV